MGEYLEWMIAAVILSGGAVHLMKSFCEKRRKPLEKQHAKELNAFNAITKAYIAIHEAMPYETDSHMEEDLLRGSALVAEQERTLVDIKQRVAMLMFRMQMGGMRTPQTARQPPIYESEGEIILPGQMPAEKRQDDIASELYDD